jgi:hypothetical protein
MRTVEREEALAAIGNIAFGIREYITLNRTLFYHDDLFAGLTRSIGRDGDDFSCERSSALLAVSNILNGHNDIRVAMIATEFRYVNAAGSAFVQNLVSSLWREGNEAVAEDAFVKERFFAIKIIADLADGDNGESLWCDDGLSSQLIIARSLAHRTSQTLSACSSPTAFWSSGSLTQ